MNTRVRVPRTLLAGAEFKLNEVDNLGRPALHCRRCCRVSFAAEGEALFVAILHHNARRGIWHKTTQICPGNLHFVVVKWRKKSPRLSAAAAIRATPAEGKRGHPQLAQNLKSGSHSKQWWAGVSWTCIS